MSDLPVSSSHPWKFSFLLLFLLVPEAQMTTIIAIESMGHQFCCLMSKAHLVTAVLDTCGKAACHHNFGHILALLTLFWHNLHLVSGSLR